MTRSIISMAVTAAATVAATTVTTTAIAVTRGGGDGSNGSCGRVLRVCIFRHLVALECVSNGIVAHTETYGDSADDAENTR